MTKNVEPSTKAGDEHNFAPVQARFVKVKMLNNSANPGVYINELMVFEPKQQPVCDHNTVFPPTLT